MVYCLWIVDCDAHTTSALLQKRRSCVRWQVFVVVVATVDFPYYNLVGSIVAPYLGLLLLVVRIASRRTPMMIHLGFRLSIRTSLTVVTRKRTELVLFGFLKFLTRLLFESVRLPSPHTKNTKNHVLITGLRQTMQRNCVSQNPQPNTTPQFKQSFLECIGRNKDAIRTATQRKQSP